MAELDENKLKTRREIIIPINLKGLAQAYEKIFHRAPIDAFQWSMAKVDGATKSMMTGYAAALTMPVGIMARNGARVAFAASKDRWFAASAFGALSGIGGAYLAGTAAYSALLPMVGGSGFAASAVAIAGAAIPGALAIAPAYTAGMLVGAAALGTLVTALSVFPAVVNFPVAVRRSVDRIRGIKYDEKMLELEYKKDSVAADRDRTQLSEVKNKLHFLSQESKLELFKSLKQEFDGAGMAPDVPQEQTARVTAATPGQPQPRG